MLRRLICSLTIQRPAPRCKSIAAFGLVELSTQLLVGLRHVVQLLPLLDSPPAHMLHGSAQRISGALARSPVADLRHNIEPFIWAWRIVVLTEAALEWLQDRPQLITLQMDPAQLRNECQAFLAHQQAVVVQAALEVRKPPFIRVPPLIRRAPPAAPGVGRQ